MECSLAIVLGLLVPGGGRVGSAGGPARDWPNSPMAVMKVSVKLHGQEDQGEASRKTRLSINLPPLGRHHCIGVENPVL